MKIVIEPGLYVVAVSGGVDSMVLLNMLRKFPGLDLTVAHFDHGIRPDSHLDRELVEATAQEYGLKLIYKEGKLGAKTSEAQAREARYDFLNEVAIKIKADAIITAHHQDDVLETAIINMLRGTNRRGLTSLNSRNDILRPLLKYPKKVIKDYAKSHNLKWREDVTNEDTSYMRNYVRHNILPKFSDRQKQQLLDHIDTLKLLNEDIDTIVFKLTAGKKLDRQMFIDLNHAVALEVMAGWLRNNGITEFDTKRLELLVRGAKTLSAGKQLDIDKSHKMKIGNGFLALV